MKTYIRSAIYRYVFADWLSTMAGWVLFFLFRKLYLENYSLSDFDLLISDKRFFLGIIIIPFGWIFLFWLLGFYTNIYRKSRINELAKTFLMILFGVIILFFTVMLDDRIVNYRDYYISVLFLVITQYVLTGFFRSLILNHAKNQLTKKKIGFNTLIIGGNKRAIEIYQEITKDSSQGYSVVGFVDTNGNSTNGLEEHLKCLGKLSQLQNLIQEYDVEEVIIAIETSEHPRLNSIINLMVNRNVIIKLIPDTFDILSGSVKMNQLLGAAFIEIYPELLSQWQYNFKRITDIVVSLVVMILLSPVYLYCMLRVKISSQGKIFYRQQRIGLHGMPFTIYKFRSMVEDAEKHGPALSNHDDERITVFGKIMRKWRLDELPQFFNVLRGDMSLIGPRPELQHYIDQQNKVAPDYVNIQRAKPGITSYGMVKFGYASTVDEMVLRMKYDLLYIENMSLLLDFKIMLYTVQTILQGKGK